MRFLLLVAATFVLGVAGVIAIYLRFLYVLACITGHALLSLFPTTTVRTVRTSRS